VLWEDDELLERRNATSRCDGSVSHTRSQARSRSSAPTFMTGQTIVIDGGVTTAAV
jgi:hypothetical protein